MSPNSRRPAADVPLGSLTRAPAVVGPATCPGCRSASLTRLSVGGRSGEPIVFVSCHDCEHTGWYSATDGSPVPRDQVPGGDK